MTLNWQDSDMLLRVENSRHFETIERSTPKGWIQGDTNVGPPLEVQVTHHLYQYRVESKIDSMQNDGSQSWIAISRGWWTYTSKSFQKRTRIPLTTKKWPPVRRNPLRQNRGNKSFRHYVHCQRLLCRSSSSSGKTFLPLITLMRNFLSFSVSKSMTRKQRHRGLHRELDGAMEWNRLLILICCLSSWSPKMDESGADRSAA